MRILIAFCLFLVTTSSLLAQTRRMSNTHMGRTYSAENLASTVWPLLQQAQQQMRLLDYEQAFLTYESAVAQFPNSAEALIFRAKFKSINGMQTQADADFQQARVINPYAADLYSYNDNRGILNLLAYEPENALQQLTAFQKLDYYYNYMDNEEIAVDHTSEDLTMLDQLLGELDQDELDNALQTAKALQQANPALAIAYDLEGLIYIQQDDLEAAIKAISQAIKVDTTFALSWYNLGTIKHQMGNLQLAKEYVDKAIKLEPNLTKAYFERAMVCKAMGDKESALANYDSIIAIRGGIYPEVFLNRALTKKMSGTYASALTDINKVIKRIPDNAEVYKNRGNLYLLLNLEAKAIDDYTKAIQLDNDYADAYYNRGLAYFLLLDKVSACGDLMESSDLGHAKAQELLSYFCIN